MAHQDSSSIFFFPFFWHQLFVTGWLQVRHHKSACHYRQGRAASTPLPASTNRSQAPALLHSFALGQAHQAWQQR